MSEVMNNVDNFWLCMDDPTNLMMISGFMEFESPLDFDRLLKTVEARLCCFDRFRQRVVRPITGVGTPTWEFDPNFDIRSHIRRIALPYPGDKNALRELISDLMAEPLDDTKPLWHFHLIENYGKGCALFIRIHHCIADGIALIFVLLSATDKTPDIKLPDSKPERDTLPESMLPPPLQNALRSVKASIGTTKTIGRMLLKGMLTSLANPMHLVEQARAYGGLAGDSAQVIAKLLLMPPHPSNSFRGKLGVRKQVAWTDPISLKKIKTIGKALDATINDVLVATVTGALRRYLNQRNDKVNDLELTVAVPVNIRKPGTEFELGNKFSLVFLSLPVYIEDPVLRLREVKRRMDKLKTSLDAFVGFTLLNTLGMSPVKVAKMAVKIFANKTTGVLTNVPGPRETLYFSGSRITNIMFWVPRSGRVGLGISIFSYDGNVTVGLAADEKLVPAPEKVLAGFDEEFHALLDIVETGNIDKAPLVLHDRYSERKEQMEQIAESDGEETQSPEHRIRETDPGPEKTRIRCGVITKSGNPCRNYPMAGSDRCIVHHEPVPDIPIQRNEQEPAAISELSETTHQDME